MSNILHASLRSEMQTLTKRYHLENASIGIAVERTNSGKTLYQYKENREFIPASNNKLFTAVAALAVLPETFSFTTTIYANPIQLKDKILHGNLYIEFTGDPTLTSSRLDDLIEKVKHYGIDQINGDVILIANRFSGDLYPEGWSKPDMEHCYAAPASTMNLNKNCMIIAVKSIGDGKSEVERLINTQGIRIVNQLKLVSHKAYQSCEFKPFMTGENVLYLTGCIPNQAETRMSFAVTNPALKTLDMLTDMLKSDHIKVTGHVAIGDLPPHLTAIAQISSSSLDYLLKHMLLHSDNLYAESIARSVGYHVDGVGSITVSANAIESVLHNKLGLNTKPLTLKDGSGLSQLDRTTPAFLASMLTKAYNDKTIGRRLYNALPSSGISGTLSYRMNKTLLGKVHAKTGTLDGVITLSGYVLTKRNHRLSFSIMINDLKDSQRRSARAFQNQAVKLFYKYL